MPQEAVPVTPLLAGRCEFRCGQLHLDLVLWLPLNWPLSFRRNIGETCALAVTLNLRAGCSLALSSIGFPYLPMVRPENEGLHESEHAPLPGLHSTHNSNLSCNRQEILRHRFPLWQPGVIQTLP